MTSLRYEVMPSVRRFRTLGDLEAPVLSPTAAVEEQPNFITHPRSRYGERNARNRSNAVSVRDQK